MAGGYGGKGGERVKATLDMKGLAEYLEDLKKLDGDIMEAAVQCADEGLKIQHEEMLKGLERHKRTGRGIEALTLGKAEIKGYIAEGEITLGKQNWQGPFFQEYGAVYKGHTLFVKDPWLRPAIDGTKGKIRKRWKEIFAEKGVKVD